MSHSGKYLPEVPMLERYRAKAEELHVDRRTVQRWTAAYLEHGEAGTASAAQCDPMGHTDPRWGCGSHGNHGREWSALTPQSTTTHGRPTLDTERRRLQMDAQLGSSATCSPLWLDVDGHVECEGDGNQLGCLH
jgi:hypothetical protein